MIDLIVIFIAYFLIATLADTVLTNMAYNTREGGVLMARHIFSLLTAVAVCLAVKESYKMFSASNNDTERARSGEKGRRHRRSKK